MLRKVTGNRMFQDVVDQIEQAIINREYQPGDRLPTERELERLLGTSRSTIRTAMRVMEQKGLIKIRAGSKGGAYVVSAFEEKMAEQIAFLIRFGEIDYDQIIQFRFSLETTAFELATQSHRPGDLQPIAGLIDRMRDCISEDPDQWREFFVIDSLLHQQICDMSGNRLIEIMIKLVHSNLWEYYERLPHDLEYLGTVYSSWVDVLTAMRTRDVVKVRVLIQAHMVLSDRWLSNWNRPG